MIFASIAAASIAAFKNVTKKKPNHTLAEYKSKVLSRFPNIPESGEVSERAAVLDHISPNDVVLEIGANVGGVSSLISSILTNSRNLVSVDPLLKNCNHLVTLGTQLGSPFNVFCGVVKGQQPLQCTGLQVLGAYVNCKPCDTPSTVNFTINEIQELYKLEFTAVVIDCEGCYKYIFPQIFELNSIKQIQIEWDGDFLEDDVLKAGFTLEETYYHQFLSKGVRVYKRK